MQNLKEPPILFVNFSQSWGGGEKWHLMAAQELSQRGYAVEIVARRRSELARMATRNAVPCVVFPVGPQAFANPLTMMRLAAYLQKQRPGAVILNGSRELKTIGFLAHVMKIPRIVYRRGIPKPIRPSLVNRLFFTRVVTDIVVNSRATQQALHELSDLPGCAPMTLLYNGLAVREQHQAQRHSRRIAVVGRLSPEKGVDLALQAFQIIARDVPAARLRIIGDGPERAQLEALSRDLQIAGQVEFMGFVDDIFDPLSECALLMLPSRWEGFGNVLLEAMQLAMPCVAFSHTSASEIIEDGVTGCLVEPLNVVQLAAHIVAFLLNPERIERMGQAGYARLCSHFSLQRSIDQLETLLGLKREM